MGVVVFNATMFKTTRHKNPHKFYRQLAPTTSVSLISTSLILKEEVCPSPHSSYPQLLAPAWFGYLDPMNSMRKGNGAVKWSSFHHLMQHTLSPLSSQQNIWGCVSSISFTAPSHCKAAINGDGR